MALLNPAGGIIEPNDQQLISLQRKRALADALGASGMDDNYQGAANYAPLLGNLAKVFAAKMVNKRLDGQEAGIQKQRSDDYQGTVAAINDAMAGGDYKAAIGAASRSTNPAIMGLRDTLLKTMIEGSENQGEPLAVRGADGAISYQQRHKSGAPTPLNLGGTLATPLTNVNGVAVDMMNPGSAPGVVLPQNVNEIMLRGPDGKPVRNELYIGARKEIAQSGASSTSTSTYVDATDKSWGRNLPPALLKQLETTQTAASNYLTAAPALREAGAIVQKGNLITGQFANARLNFAKTAELLGLGGATDRDKIANTETFLRTTGQQMLPILAALRPASDTDVIIARKMAGADATLSLAEVRRAVKAAEEAGQRSVQLHNGKVDQVSGLYKNNSELYNGLQTFKVQGGGAKAPAGKGGLTPRQQELLNKYGPK